MAPKANLNTKVPVTLSFPTPLVDQLRLMAKQREVKMTILIQQLVHLGVISLRDKPLRAEDFSRTNGENFSGFSQ